MNTKRKQALTLSLTLFVLTVFLVGCSQTPTEPGKPGAVGQARAAVTGYATPTNFDITPA